MTVVGYAQLHTTDPDRWRETAAAWRAWAATAGRWAAELRAHAARLATIWTGAAAAAATTRLTALIRGLTVFRLGCWAADQALSEFAAALTRARAMLHRAGRPGVSIAADGRVSGHPPNAVREAAAAITTALTVAGQADATSAGRLGELTVFSVGQPTTDPPPCTATPPEVQRWWEALSPAQRRWLLATTPRSIGSLDGVPAASRDLANRLLLHGTPVVGEIDQVAGGLRAYVLGVDPGGDGRAVVALGDPDRAANVLTQVPGMTADLASYGGELARAERIAARAGELTPESPASTIMWLGYDAPDFLPEAASRAQADAGAVGLRRFQEGLRATHLDPPARQTVVGHSYGSLVVGAAAARPGLAADSVVFVGSPGVGVDSAAELRVPAGEVWSSTSFSDVIQWAAVSPRSLAEDLLVPGAAPLTLGRPENELYYGTNPSDPAFGARLFASDPGAGHLGYWDGRALDALATIAVGRGDVIPR